MKRAVGDFPGELLQQLRIRRVHEPEASATRRRSGKNVGRGRADNHTVRRQHLPRPIQNLTTDVVEHQVNIADDVFETLRLVVKDKIGAEASDVIQVRSACRCKDLCARPFGVLHGISTEPTGGAMNQDSLTREDRPRVMKTVPRRNGCYRHGGRMDVLQPLRRQGKTGLINGHEFSVSAQCAHRAHDTVAHTETRGSGPDRLNHSGHLGAQYDGQWQRERVAHMTFANLPVDAIHARGPNPNQNLAVLGGWLLDLGNCRGLRATVGAYQYSTLKGVHGNSSYRVPMTRN
ncbi:hypothetical protein EMIT0215P_90181 [Pseudomonas serboccidentalis]